MTVQVKMRLPGYLVPLLGAEAQRRGVTASACAAELVGEALGTAAPVEVVGEFVSPDEKDLPDVMSFGDRPARHWHRMSFPVPGTEGSHGGRRFALHRCACGKLSPKPYLVTT